MEDPTPPLHTPEVVGGLNTSLKALNQSGASGRGQFMGTPNCAGSEKSDGIVRGLLGFTLGHACREKKCPEGVSTCPACFSAVKMKWTKPREAHTGFTLPQQDRKVSRSE